MGNVLEISFRHHIVSYSAHFLNRTVEHVNATFKDLPVFFGHNQIPFHILQ